MMYYSCELDFLKSTLSKCSMQYIITDLSGDGFLSPHVYFNNLIAHREDYDRIAEAIRSVAAPNTVYRYTDRFLCSYMFFLLPEYDEEKILFLGPYLGVELSHSQVMEIGEELGIPGNRLSSLERFYSSVPFFPGSSPIFAIINTFCEKLWGGEGSYTTVDINREFYGLISPILPHNADADESDILEQKRIIERRYTWENEMMQAVSQGLVHKAELLLSSMSDLTFERRNNDPVRNLKNYCIVMNTLLRKAAEQGEVHPIHLDRISSDFARKIEALTSSKSGRELMLEMFRSYCYLVRQSSMKNYCTPVQEAISYIDANPAGNLTLHNIARIQNVNASYLSSLFSRETGKTLTEYVNRRRIKLAVHLLSTTKLQVQTVAQHCGIPDVNYFSKLFKRYTGQSPKEFRAMQVKSMD
ncbi:MAG: helix-turn-helix transcriptional regulator [Acutalibacteraceae bacterium]